MCAGINMIKRIEYTLWLFAAMLLIYWAVVKTQVVFAQAEAVKRIDALIVATELDTPDRSQWSRHRIEEHSALKGSLGAAEALAILEIPIFDLRVAVFNGTSDEVLNVGIGRIPGTAIVGEAGNLGLAGHRDGFFRPLKDISIGDEIVVRHPGGVERYTVSDLLIVNPENVSVLAPTSAGRLTLVTCYPFYFVGDAPKRYIVVADNLTI